MLIQKAYRKVYKIDMEIQDQKNEDKANTIAMGVNRVAIIMYCT